MEPENEAKEHALKHPSKAKGKHNSGAPRYASIPVGS
jgi:hypothetical protein